MKFVAQNQNKQNKAVLDNRLPALSPNDLRSYNL
jgi:hypothetical protein